MSTFPLDQMDEHLLKQIVRKFTPTSGAGFYRSCRGAKNFVDRLKPFGTFSECTTRIGNRQYLRKIPFPNALFEFCRIEEVQVDDCGTDHFKTVILAQIAAIGRVGKLIYLSEDAADAADAQMLVAAVKPEALELFDVYPHLASATFEGAKNLYLHVLDESYWRTKKLFELARNWKTITFKYSFWEIDKEIIASFIENWPKGEQTGNLERLTFSPDFVDLDDLSLDESVTFRKELEDLMKSHIKTEEGYIVERGGLDRLRIAVDFNTLQVDFYFS